MIYMYMYLRQQTGVLSQSFKSFIINQLKILHMVERCSQQLQLHTDAGMTVCTVRLQWL